MRPFGIILCHSRRKHHHQLQNGRVLVGSLNGYGTFHIALVPRVILRMSKERFNSLVTGIRQPGYSFFFDSLVTGIWLKLKCCSHDTTGAID